MLKSFWPLWLLAGALTLCMVGMVWLHTEVQGNAATIGALQSINEATAKTLQGLQEQQDIQEAALLGWQKRQQSLTQAARTKAKTMREAAKNADFQSWADQPLPADAFRVLQSTGLAH